MKVLVVGSGGREHALCWSLKASSLVSHVYCSPGNGGISDIADCVDVDVMDFSGIVQLCHSRSIDLVVIGPEAPLTEGLVDYLKTAGIKAFGPSHAAAVLEGSKGFTKDFCKRHGVPTARYERFEDSGAAKAYIDKEGAPIVVKADGLAAGKGVIVCNSKDEAEKAIDMMLVDKKFGRAGDSILIEERIDGIEASYIALADGKIAIPMATSQDHKRVFDNDNGPNTGGMGAYSPTPIIDDKLSKKIQEKIIDKTILALANENIVFNGFLYAGIMIKNGEPYVLEYNVRMGDPECQPILMRMESDLFQYLIASINGELEKLPAISWKNKSSVCVVLAAKGYPESYQKNDEISGIEEIIDDAYIFHAGTKKHEEKILTNGGRVLGVTALGDTLESAVNIAYQGVEKITWANKYCRTDIGKKGLNFT